MINLILSDTKRSEKYISELYKQKFKINIILIYSVKKKLKFLNKIGGLNFFNKIIVIKVNEINKINIKYFKEIDKNDTNFVSTYSGEIIKNINLIKKNLIHCHPGDLPKFKGSTTIYYSLILKKNVSTSLFIINSKIDSGKILFKKNFEPPKKVKLIEGDYDYLIRAKTICAYLKLKKKRAFYLNKSSNLPYYIAHPIIRQIIHNKKYLY